MNADSSQEHELDFDPVLPKRARTEILIALIGGAAAASAASPQNLLETLLFVTIGGFSIFGVLCVAFLICLYFVRRSGGADEGETPARDILYAAILLGIVIGYAVDYQNRQHFEHVRECVVEAQRVHRAYSSAVGCFH